MESEVSVFGPREVPDIDAMNQALLDNHNDVVRPDDEVWYVGDVVMGHFETGLNFMRKFHGRKYLIPGNHDRCHKMHRYWNKFQPAYEAAGFTVLDGEVKTHVGKTSVKVCHFPYRFTHKSDDRYSGQRPDQEGGWLIHGHTHSAERVDYESRSIHVGVDAHSYSPVSEDWVERVIQGVE